MHKFERLEVWQLAIEYADLCYAIAAKLPKQEEYNLALQMRRAAISIALNIAEGSTSQTDPEQARFLAIAIRSLIETVACQHLIHRRNYLADTTPLREAYQASEKLVAKLQAMRRKVLEGPTLQEDGPEYIVDARTPFDEMSNDKGPKTNEERPTTNDQSSSFVVRRSTTSILQP